MPIMNKDAWAAEHGFQVLDGGRLAAPTAGPESVGGAPGPEGASPDLEAQLRSAMEVIAYQRDLIRQLQTALRSELAKRQASPAPAGGVRGTGTAQAPRAVRRRRAASGVPPAPAPPPATQVKG